MNGLRWWGALLVLWGLLATGYADSQRADDTVDPLELGRRIYMEGRLPSGELITAYVRGDIALTGEHAICGTCHRRSGMGSTEGYQVVPALAADILFEPLRLPTTRVPLAPIQRPAYTMETLKRAIRSGIDAKGQPLDALMPRYPLSDRDLELLIGYLRSLSREPSPGVDDKDIHFATIIAGDVEAGRRKAITDVVEAFVKKKNTESRNEITRAEHAPWHKKWVYGPYRKWRIHIWELEGPPESWRAQLEALYKKQPVFAVLSGVAQGPWAPIHGFCKDNRIPCLFPTTDLPVVDEEDFYNVYFSRGMAFEAELIGRYLRDIGEERRVVQVLRAGDPYGEMAAVALESYLGKDRVHTLRLDNAADASLWRKALKLAGDRDGLVVWLRRDALSGLWAALGETALSSTPVYLSSTLFGTWAEAVPQAFRAQVLLAHSRELPDRLYRRLLRGIMWFRRHQIDNPAQREVQGNMLFTLKVTGEVLTFMRGYFFRDYMIEKIEHMLDNVTFSSVYPRLSMAPDQRFVAKGGYLLKVADGREPRLVAASDWLIP